MFHSSSSLCSIALLLFACLAHAAPIIGDNDNNSQLIHETVRLSTNVPVVKRSPQPYHRQQTAFNKISSINATTIHSNKFNYNNNNNNNNNNITNAATKKKASSASSRKTTSLSTGTCKSKKKKTCFPALNHTMPSTVPSSLKNWWCDMEDEYAFLGFSYEISACQSQAKLTKDFTNARKTFNSRYIRLYGACDDVGYYDKVVEAAWEAGLGVQALIWFGFDGSTTLWKKRRAALFKSLETNPKAKFVTRAVQFGSEPLFDWAIDPSQLAIEVKAAQKTLANMSIPVTVSDLAYGFQSTLGDGSQKVIDAIDFVDVHMLPYFSSNATTGGKAWYNNMYDMGLMLKYTKSNKKIIWSENGWPSKHYCPGVCPNSATAVSSVASSKAYFDMLDQQCTKLKAFPKGGVGWFAHIYSDSQEPGYGIYTTNGTLKFDFSPRTHC